MDSICSRIAIGLQQILRFTNLTFFLTSLKNYLSCNFNLQKGKSPTIYTQNKKILKKKKLDWYNFAEITSTSTNPRSTTFHKKSNNKHKKILQFIIKDIYQSWKFKNIYLFLEKRTYSSNSYIHRLGNYSLSLSLSISLSLSLYIYIYSTMNLGSKSNRFNNYMETITLNCGLKTNKHPNFLNRNFF